MQTNNFEDSFCSNELRDLRQCVESAKTTERQFKERLKSGGVSRVDVSPVVPLTSCSRAGQFLPHLKTARSTCLASQPHLPSLTMPHFSPPSCAPPLTQKPLQHSTAQRHPLEPLFTHQLPLQNLDLNLGFYI